MTRSLANPVFPQPAPPTAGALSGWTATGRLSRSLAGRLRPVLRWLWP